MDDEATPNSDTIAVTINLTNVNEAPEFPTSETGTRNIDENTAANTNIGNAVAATDDDNDTLTYDLTGADASSFDFDTSTGQIKTKDALDHETKESYSVSVTVRDSKDADGNSDMAVDATKAVTITVNDINEAPEFPTSETGTRNIDENTAANMNIGAEVAATDDDNDTLTYALTGTDASSFDIVTTTGQIKTKDPLDHETKDSYTVMVTVHDGLDAASNTDTTVDDTQAVTITVNDINDAPEFSAATATRTLPENSGAGVNVVGGVITATDDDSDTLTYSLASTGDHGSFEIDSSGQIKTKTGETHSFDFESSKKSYRVTVQVRDSKDDAGMADSATDDTIDVTINLTNVNEPPVITSIGMAYTAVSFAEIAFDVDTSTLTAADRELETYVASDPDAGASLSWSLSGADAASFDIDSNGKLSFKSTVTPDYENPDDVFQSPSMEGDNEYNIVVEVKDGLADSGNAANAVDDTQAVTVTVTDVNETPVISGDGTPSFAEIEYDVDGSSLTTANLSIPGTYTFTDEDGDDVTWSLIGTDANHFEVTKNADGSSFVSFRNPTPNTTDKPADFENPVDTGANNTYVFVVEATDDNTTVAPHNLKGTYTVTYVDETPEFTNPPANRDFPEIEYDFDGTPDLFVATFTARDEEMEDITWTLASSGDNDDLTITENMAGEGVLTFNSEPNFEVSTGSGTPNNVYEITVVITDATASPNTDANQRTLDYVVTVTDVNERPDIVEVTDNTLEYPEVDFYYTLTPDSVHTFTAVDYDDLGMDPFTWSLLGVDAGDLRIDPSTDMPPKGVLTFNQDSSLNVGPLPSYEDPKDDDTDNTYEITVIATDDDSYAAEYDVTITVTDEEEEGRVAAVLPHDPPLVNDVLTFTLSDPDGGIVLTAGEIDWTIEARNPGGTEQDWESIDDDDPQSLVKTYTVDEDYTGKEIRATVTYKDRYDVENTNPSNTVASDDTNSVMDKRTVAPPRFREGASQTIPEWEAGRDTDVEIMGTDRDGEVLIFGIQDGQDSDLFEIIPSDSTVTRTIQNVDYTGYAAQLRAIEALDYETVTSRSSTCPSKSLCLTLTLSDGKAESNGRDIYDDEIDVDDFEVTVTVTNVEEPGEVTFSPDEVPEPGVQIEATHTDPDGSITGRMWEWQRSEDPEADPPVWDNISGATSSTYTPDATNDVIASGDNDGEGYYLRATVTYTDGQDSGKSAMAVAGQVGTANTRPQFPPSETGTRSVPENARAGTNIGDPVAANDPENNSLTYSLSEDSVHGEAFTIVSSTGQLRVKEPLDFEEQQIYIVTIEVSDRRDAAGRSSTHIDDTLENVLIRVENVDEEGSVTLTTVTNSIQATVPITTELEDPDGSLSNLTWQWARSSNRSDWTDITNATNNVYTPTAADDQGNYLRATATYTDGHGPDKDAEIVTSRVAGPPPTNAAPVFPDSEDGQRQIREDASSGTLIQGPIQATDFNNDALTYTLTGSDSSFFDVDSGNGQLRLQLEQDEALDYERKRTYRFTVRVSDGKNDDDELDDPDNLRIDDTITVTVTLIDVNEPPAITGESEREFRENGTSSVATYSARDPEGDTVAWSLSGTDADSFVITDRGQLYFKEPPSFESRTPSEYSVIIEASDGTLYAMLNVTVTVTDVEERGTATIFPVKGWVEMETDPNSDAVTVTSATRFTATLEDGDVPITIDTWQWARSSSQPIEGATSSSYTATAEDVNQYLRATATYRDNRSIDPTDPMEIEDKTATAVLRARIGDTRPEANTQPQFTVPESEDAPEGRFDTRTITSGAVARRNVGSRVRATDEDGDVLTYMLRGRDADKFDFDPATGQIRTKEALDYLEQDTYTLSVSVHDGFDATYRPSASIDDTISIIITVLPPPPTRRAVRRSTTSDDSPPNRPPEFADGETTNRSVVQGTETGIDFGRPVTASDPDGDTLTYTLGGTDGESFDIDAMTGQLKTRAALDAETKSSYSVTVSVTDGKNAGGGTLAEIDDTITVDITVATVALSELAAMYDADEDGLISRDEALAALNDFFSGDITRDEALEVIALYFESPATVTELLGDSG